jgi:3-methyladenine DNA glycosylase Tag
MEGLRSAEQEVLVLSGAQAGLSWSLVLKKREGYRRAFDNFDPEKVALYSERRIQRLTSDPEIIRRMKIAAAVRNARALLKIQEESGALVGMVNDHLVDCFRYREISSRMRRSRRASS